MKRKFLIDTDCGLDDAMAIMMALSSEDLEVVAITCVNGNAPVNCVTINVLRTLEACGCPRVPVHRGADKPIMGNYTFDKPCDFHGLDGFGDCAHLLSSPNPSLIQKEHAVNALIRLILQHPGEITLVALGPLTNIALAIRMENTFASKVKKMYIMGGNAEGKGNVTVSAEANFSYDPEAAFIVLNEMQCEIHITPWESCLKHYISWDWRQTLLQIGTNQSNLIRLIETNIEHKSKGFEGYILCDQFAMADAITDTSVVTRVGPYHVTVEPHGHYTRGQMIVDRTGMLSKNGNTYIVEEFSMDVVKKLLIKAVSG